MAGKDLIAGTSYEKTGGKTLIDGTAYEITLGKTMVDGGDYVIEVTSKFKVDVSGNTNASYAYVEVDGQKYMAGDIASIPENTEIKVHVGATSSASSVSSKCYVNLNGEKVQSGAGDYTMQVTGNVYVYFSYINVTYLGRRYNAYYASITTE